MEAMEPTKPMEAMTMEQEHYFWVIVINAFMFLGKINLILVLINAAWIYIS